MTGKKTLLYDVRGFNGGYVGFTGNQGGRIIGEGTLSNGIVTFERVNYIAELENNLLSISHVTPRKFLSNKIKTRVMWDKCVRNRVKYKDAW